MTSKSVLKRHAVQKGLPVTNIYTDNSVVIANMQITIDDQKALIEKMREALKMPNEDVLLDLYKIHAYIPFDADNNPLTPYGNFAQGFGVAFSMFEALALSSPVSEKAK